MQTPAPGQLPQITWDNNPRQDDIEAVRALIHSTKVFSPEEIRLAGEKVADALMGDHSDYAFVFARTNQGKRLAGYACFAEIPLTDNRYDLHWIAVQPSLRGLNLGAELLLRAEHRIRNSGGRILYSTTSGRDECEPARQFYHKNGFIQCANIPDFYKLGHSKLIYSKRLMPAGAPRVSGM